MEPRHTRSISVAEVAQNLGVPRPTVNRWINSKGMPAHQVGGVWKFQLLEMDASAKDQILNGTGQKTVRADKCIVDSTKQVG